MSITNEELVDMAYAASEKAYAPYSDFHVGAALLTADGKIFTGCNVENASYGATICAERTAMVKAISEGSTRFSRIAIVSQTHKYTYPCGICRQVLSEFMDSEGIVLVADDELGIREMRLRELLPESFTL